MRPSLRLPASLVALALVGLSAAPALAAAPELPLAGRSHGNVLGDGLREQGGLGLSSQPFDPLAAQVCAAGETLFGIDVSYYQGDIDWNAVAGAGVVYAWTRVSHSTSFQDPKFAANLAGARAAGIHVGAYQYFEPSEDPIAQAQLLLDLLGPLQPGDMPPMIDVESKDAVPQAEYVNAVRAWLDHVEAATGTVPFIYTGYYYWNDHLGATAEFVDHPLWIANYNNGCPLVPDAWPTWTAHQYCDCGDVAGIDGAVDVNEFNGGLDVLLGHAVGGAVCGDAKCVSGEDAYNCAADCPPCGVIAPEGGTIDDGQACLELLGDPIYWRHEPVGEGGTLAWTNVTEYADPSNYAIYRMYFAEAGLYSLEVYVQKPFGETQQSKYRVQHAGGETIVPVNQAMANGWVNLGEFNFNAATDHFVRIDDNTGEPVALELSLVADALRITRLDLDETTSGGLTTGPDPTTSSDGDDSSGAVTMTPTTTAEPATTSTAGGSETSGSAGLPADFGEEDGCGCAQGNRGAGGLLALVGLLGLGRRRRALQPRA